MVGERISRAVLEFVVDDAAVVSGLKRIDSTLSSTTGNMAASLRTLGQQARTAGAALTAAVTLPLVAIATGAAKLAIDFESSFAGVRKTVNATEPEFIAMARSFRQLSTTIPINVNDLNRLGEAAGALGIPKDEIVSFAKVMAQLGVTTNVTADQAAESIAKIQNIFGAAGKDTDRFAATLVALGNDGASTEVQILELANRIASAGNAVGLTQGQVLGFGAAIANVGIEAEAGGTAISKVFIDLSQAVSNGGAELRSFAKVADLTSEEFATAFKTNAADATRRFIEGLGRIKQEGGDLNKTITELGFTEVRQSNLLRSLALSGDNLSKSLNLQATAWRENTALSEEARKRFATTEAQLRLLWNRIQDVGITLGNALLPTIQALVGFVGGLIPVLQGAAQLFTALPAPIQLTALGLVGLAAAIGPLVFVFGQLAIASAALTTAFAANGVATKLLFADLGFLVIGFRNAVSAVSATALQMTAMSGVVTGLGTAVRALWATMLAHPLVALAAGVGAVTLALTKLYERSVNHQQKALIDGIKAETIARAQQAGVVLKSADAHARYLEAVDALQKIETIRQAKFNTSIPLQRQAVAAELELGRITQEQANVRLAALAGEQQASQVREKRIAITEIAALAEAAFQKEITATGYSVAQLQKLIKDDPQTFAAYAKQVGLTSETVARLKEGLERAKTATTDLAKEQKDTAREADELARHIEAQGRILQAFGVITEQEVTEELNKFRAAISMAIAQGAPFGQVLVTLVPKLQALADRAKDGGLHVDDLVDTLRALKAESARLNPAPIFPPSLFLSGQAGFAALTKGVKTITAEQFKAMTTAGLLKAGYETLGITTQRSLDETARKAQQAYADIKNSGQATERELKAAAKRVAEAEAAAAGKTLMSWEDAFDTVASGFQQMAQIAGGGFSAVARGVGTGLSSVATFGKSLKAINEASSFKGALAGISGLIGAISQGITVAIAFGKALHDALTRSTAEKAASDIRREFKVDNVTEDSQVSQDVEATIKRLSKGGRGVDRHEALTLNLPQIIDAAGGVTAKNFSNFQSRATELFALVARGGAIGEEALASLDATMGALGKHVTEQGGIWDRDFIAMLARANAEGLELQSTLELLKGQVTKLASSSQAIAGGTKGKTEGAFKAITGLSLDEADDVVKQFEEMQRDVAAAKVALAKQAAAADTESEQARLAESQAEITASEKRLAELGRQVAGFKTANATIRENTQTEFDRVNRIILAAFNTSVANGQTAVEAVRAIGPAIDDLQAAAKRFGFAGSAAFDQLSRWRTLTTANAPLLESISGLTDMMTALGNLGALDAATFADMQAQGLSAFTDMTNAGFTQKEAFKEIGPLLATIVQLHEQNGLAIDASTQALIDQAREQGALKEKEQTTQEVIKEGLSALLKGLKIDLPAAWRAMADAGRSAAKDVTDALNGIPSPTIDINYRPNMPDFAPAGGGPSLDAIAAQGFDVGTPGLDFARFNRRGTPIIAHGDEAIIPRGGGHQLATEIASALSTMGGRGGGGGVAIIQLEGREIARAIVPHIPDEVKWYKGTR